VLPGCQEEGQIEDGHRYVVPNGDRLFWRKSGPADGTGLGFGGAAGLLVPAAAQLEEQASAASSGERGEVGGGWRRGRPRGWPAGGA